MIGVWIVLVAMLAGLGRDIEHKLNTQLTYIDGTPSKRAHEIVQREFGGDYTIVAMLHGPRVDVERQGRALARRLNGAPRMHAISPWAPGAAIEGLAPRPGIAAFVVRVERPPDVRVEDLAAPVKREVDAVVSKPVRVSLAGLPVIGDSYRQDSEEAAKVGQLIGIPILLFVLLFVFRSVLAAIVPVVVGGAVVAATRGVLSLLVGVVDLDLFSISVAGMMGLALGVDYSLLVVSRFREEREHRDVAEAAQATVEATARSILPAGGGLVLAMLVSMVVLPGSTTISVALTVIIVTVLSVLSAMCVTPALLTLLGPNLERWSLPERSSSRMVALRWSRRLARRPRAVVAIVIGLLLCSVLAFTLNTAVSSVKLLPSGDSGRVQQEDVERGLGSGWVGPIEVVVSGRDGPVTSPSRLQALADFQKEAEGDPAVATVAGFGKLASRASKITGIESGLAEQERGLNKLGTGIARLQKGAAGSSTGLLKAADGARALDAGLGAANTGAGLLANGLHAVGTGSGRLTEGLSRVNDGSDKLAEGTTKASTGASRLAKGVEGAQEGIGEIQGSADLLESAMHSGNDRLAELHGPLHDTGEQLGAAWQALQRMTTGRSDPEYAAVARAIEEANRHLEGTDIRTGEQSDPSFGGVETGVERAEGQFGVGLYLSSKLGKNGGKAEEGVKKLAKASAGLARGLHHLATGSKQLSGGVAKLSGGGEKLSPAMRQLGEGAERLAGGLGQLEGGAGQLAGGLGGGSQQSKLLTGALHKIGLGLHRQREGGSQFAQLQKKSPGLFHSGYFVLSALDGSHPEQREQLGFMINLEHGGLAARMLIIPRGEPSSTGTREAKERLEKNAGRLARKTGMEVVVGGVAPAEFEINKVLRDQAPVLRIVLALVTFIVLLLVMRSLTLSVISALLNVVTVTASFGLLALLFNNSLLGGPGFVDASVLPATVMVIFGLAIDYEVFVFARIREEYVRTGSTSAAIAKGLDHTAPVVTGAGLIMIAVFLSFAVSDFMLIRNFGVAQAIAVFLDAFVIRLIVIPALMTRLGERSWWIPRWLDRILPGQNPIAAGATKGESAPAA